MTRGSAPGETGEKTSVDSEADSTATVMPIAAASIAAGESVMIGATVESGVAAANSIATQATGETRQ